GIGLFALAHAAFSAAQHYFPSSGIKWKRKCEFLQSSSFQDKIFRSMYYVYDLQKGYKDSANSYCILFTQFLSLVTSSITMVTQQQQQQQWIVLQTLLAFAVTCYGIVHIAGEFKDMDATSELKNKTFDTLRNHPSFYVFNHRGRVLFRPSDTTNSSNQDALSSNTSLKLRKLESLRR
ncbi:PREDICTED: membrane magnesium transporter 1-like, partial [Bison bison bison]|uniref:Membrane magnesium transporter 1-like n=1 Tax=Bison bison bison TaxID=43346 RepID=A0A6P3GW95_BISBB